MFCVHDASIRLVLLTHLNAFIRTFQIDDLKYRVLPELLVGIKDTDDYLVSTTLRALADLVPILGAATVIGGNRGRLFTDGRPNKIQRSKKNHHVTFATPSKTVNTLNVPNGPEQTPALYLPERPSPDGGEDRTEVNFTFSEEENWSDWEAHDTEDNSTDSALKDKLDESTDAIVIEEELMTVTPLTLPSSTALAKKYPNKKPVISDISELDIKHSKSMTETAEEIDFFTDMEPVIQKTQILHVEEVRLPEANNASFTSNLVPTATEADGDGWGDDDLDNWGVEGADDGVKCDWGFSYAI